MLLFGELLIGSVVFMQTVEFYDGLLDEQQKHSANSVLNTNDLRSNLFNFILFNKRELYCVVSGIVP